MNDQVVCEDGGYSRHLRETWTRLVEANIAENSFVSGYWIGSAEILNEICDGVSDRSVHNDADDILMFHYLRDLWRMEFGGPDAEWKDEVCAYIVDCKWEDARQIFREQGHQQVYTERMVKKLQNIREVIQAKFFGMSAKNHTPVDATMHFTMSSVKELHKSIMAGLLDNAGEFRKHTARPAGVAVIYLMPSKIECRLNGLLEFTRTWLCRLCSQSQCEIDQLRNIVLLASVFLSEFLYIHPFSNGNGRTARVLVSLLLSSVCDGVFSLYVNPPAARMNPRDLYLSVLSSLHERMLNEHQVVLPDVLATYILLSMQRHVSHARFQLKDPAPTRPVFTIGDPLVDPRPVCRQLEHTAFSDPEYSSQDSGIDIGSDSADSESECSE